MIILGMDTSGYANAIGIIDGEQVLADCNFETRTDSLEKIVANIDFALQSAGLVLGDIQGIGVGLGPGSWTGIRVGVTVGKVLAFSADKPVVGVPTLEALAYGARNESSPICVIISAGTGDMVYAGFYHTGDGNVTRTGDYYVGGVPGLSAMVKESTVLVGPEAESYSRLISQATGNSYQAVQAVPGGVAIGRLAAGRLERGESDDALSLTPLYLKESAARVFMNKYSGNVRGRE